MSAEPDDYDEFAMLGDNAAEAGLARSALPPVSRMSVTLAGGQAVSALAWGDAQPELVLLHGGGQNAHPPVPSSGCPWAAPPSSGWRPPARTWSAAR